MEPEPVLVFPAVDIAKGRAVRLLQGDPERETVYFDSPADAAAHWAARGAEALHVVDLDGALATGRNDAPVREILSRVTMPVEVAGGLRDEQAVQRILDAGAVRAVVGTRAVQDPDWAVALCRAFPGRIVIALDAIDGRVAVDGWQAASEVTPVDLAQRLAEGGPAAFLYTDVSRDGMLTEPHFDGTEALLDAVDVPVIASGGVARLEDIRRLGEMGADAVITGKALYEGRFELADAIAIAAAYPSRLPARPAVD
jgi:phosphoribosylformimino-5-aminoimidazole carboxamide ribotide isomerase